MESVGRFTETQIVGIIRELDAGATASEVARRHGVHPNTVALWRSKYGGLEPSDLARLKQLEAENSEMERIIARQVLELRAMENLIRKNSWGPQRVKKR